MYVTYALEDPRDKTVCYVGMTNDWCRRYAKAALGPYNWRVPPA